MPARSATFFFSSAEQMAEAMRAANFGAGVLCLYGNYGGDVMNFDMAGECWRWKASSQPRCG